MKRHPKDPHPCWPVSKPRNQPKEPVVRIGLPLNVQRWLRWRGTGAKSGRYSLWESFCGIDREMEEVREPFQSRHGAGRSVRGSWRCGMSWGRRFDPSIDPSHLCGDPLAQPQPKLERR